jgi:hypothetical protein
VAAGVKLPITGTGAGVTLLDGTDSALSPLMLLAWTVNV